jgi:hypothetical protein
MTTPTKALLELASRVEQTDWIEEGRKHFLATKLHPEKLAENYPSQDVHTLKDEADFILGFRAAKGEWERGIGLTGLGAYTAERDERALAAQTGDAK